MRILIAVLKLLAFALITLWVIPTQLLILAFHKGPGAYIAPKLWHKGVCLIFGIRLFVEGKPVQNQQTLFMSNHLSYLDIPVLGSLITASFVAKKDVEGWPLFGFLATLQQTAFIDRSRTAAAKEMHNLNALIKTGKSLILFPEGTSTDGRTLRPFKSSLFAAPLESENPDLLIQPVSLEMEQVNGRAVETQKDRDLYSWHIDMDTELPVHLWLFALTSGARIKIKFHPPLRVAEFQDRKVLAGACYEHVRSALKLAESAS